ncbi:S-layer homology domain-containing protein [Paenibacillus sp. NPDC058071]|uniref:S-layer homology domain-containing protein n=1 Tax=Paenibacillus sp. NPDC058071 TaxID=3346326 RepID=UPI0036DAE4AC
MRKKSILIGIMMLLVFSLSSTVYAFSDTKGDPNESKIAALQKEGIIGGEKNDSFNGKGKLTYAAGISMIVKGLDLNLDDIRFIRQPLANEYFPNLKNDAWYSNAFVVGQFRGLEIPSNVKPNDEMTKEQFAHHLFKAVLTKGDYMFIDLFVQIHDEADINKNYMDSIQKLLITKIAVLDEKQNFNPKRAITRSESAGWLYDAIKFAKDSATTIKPLPGPDYELTVTPVNKEINKVTVSTTLGHPGYGFRIVSIVFEGDKAIILAEITEPDPDKVYPQVLTEAKVSTYVDAAYTPVLAGASTSKNSPAVQTNAAQ